MSSNPIQTAARRANRARRLPPDAACARCGVTTTAALMGAPRSLLETHHVCGRANDAALTVPLCRNCHAVLTESQRTAGVDLTPPPTRLHQLAAFLTALAAVLCDLAKRLMAAATRLTSLTGELDAAYPAWRSLPSAGVLP